MSGESSGQYKGERSQQKSFSDHVWSSDSRRSFSADCGNWWSCRNRGLPLWRRVSSANLASCNNASQFRGRIWQWRLEKSCQMFKYGLSRCGRTPIPPSLLSVSPHTSTAIVGGTPATPYSWPWQAVVCKNGELFLKWEARTLEVVFEIVNIWPLSVYNNGMRCFCKNGESFPLGPPPRTSSNLWSRAITHQIDLCWCSRRRGYGKTAVSNRINSS